MMHEPREVPEGVSPYFIALPIKTTGVDDSALRRLTSKGEVTYLTQQFCPASSEQQRQDPLLIGVWLVYTEVRINPEIERINQRLRDDSLTPKSPPLYGEVKERYEKLAQWRRAISRALKIPAYSLFNNVQLEEIAKRSPTTLHQLGQIKGVGKQKLRKYGDSVLAILRDGADPLTWPAPQDETEDG